MNHKTIKQEYGRIVDDLEAIRYGKMGVTQSQYDCLGFREKAYCLALKLLNVLNSEQMELSWNQFEEFVLTSPVVKTQFGGDLSLWIGGNRSYKSSVIYYAKELIEE